MTEINKNYPFNPTSVTKSTSYPQKGSYINPTRKDFETKSVQGFTLEQYVQSTPDGSRTSFYVKVYLPSRIYIDIRIPLY